MLVSELKRYGSLTVICPVPGRAQNGQKVLTVCDCGVVSIKHAVNIYRGRTRTCGRHKQRHDVLTYANAHQRVRAARGKASAYTCADECGSQAQDWSYSYEDPEELWGLAQGCVTPVAYSSNPDYYTPRCRRCHKKFDTGIQSIREHANV